MKQYLVGLIGITFFVGCAVVAVNYKSPSETKIPYEENSKELINKLTTPQPGDVWLTFITTTKEGCNIYTLNSYPGGVMTHRKTIIICPKGVGVVM